MKKTLLGIAIAGLLATAATAGTLNDPIVENDVIAADAVATSSTTGPARAGETRVQVRDFPRRR